MINLHISKNNEKLIVLLGISVFLGLTVYEICDSLFITSDEAYFLYFLFGYVLNTLFTSVELADEDFYEAKITAYLGFLTLIFLDKIKIFKSIYFSFNNTFKFFYLFGNIFLCFFAYNFFKINEKFCNSFEFYNFFVFSNVFIDDCSKSDATDEEIKNTELAILFKLSE